VTKAEKAHKEALAGIGCIVCRKEFGITDGPVQLHHLRSGGWGKGDYTTLIPLCYEHHMGDTGIHGMGTKAFERRYGPQVELLKIAKGLI
jgi:hypothetical protein